LEFQYTKLITLLQFNQHSTPIINHYTYFALYYSTSQLDHLPQIARAKEIKTHFLQKQAHESADARKAAERGATGAIVSLGLVEEEGGGK
jgi:hypothetical protein